MTASIAGGASNSHRRAKTGPPALAEEVGIDTWRLVRYLDRDSDLERALDRCALPSARGVMAAEPVAGHRVGVLPGHRMLWVEGHPAVEGLAAPTDLSSAEGRVLAALEQDGFPLGRDGGVGRLDQTVTLRFPDGDQGLAFLAGCAVLDAPRCKPVVYGRPPETVYWVGDVSGKRLARIYDKGYESRSAPRGTLVRLENQTRYTKEARRAVNEIDTDYAARKFASRFSPVAASAEGVTAATLPLLAEHVAQLVASGDMTTRQAERLVGFLALQGQEGPTYPARTRKRRRRELRDHGLVLVDPLHDPVDVDLGEALDAALAAWTADA